MGPFNSDLPRNSVRLILSLALGRPALTNSCGAAGEIQWKPFLSRSNHISSRHQPLLLRDIWAESDLSSHLEQSSGFRCTQAAIVSRQALNHQESPPAIALYPSESPGPLLLVG